jgi:hypothetical protein
MQFLSKSLLILMTFVVAGCSTVVEKTYRPEIVGADQKQQLVRPNGINDISIERVKFDGGDIGNLIHQRFPNHRVVGSAVFRTSAVGDDELKRQALTSGASKVLLVERWTGTVQTGMLGNAIPIGGGGALAIATPMLANNYEFAAVFLANYSGGKDRIGIVMAPLTPELQQKFERNKGVLVESTIPHGGAFDANVLSGDIMIKVADSLVIDLASVGELIRTSCKKGPPFTIEVLRGPEGKSRQLTLLHCD